MALRRRRSRRGQVMSTATVQTNLVTAIATTMPPWRTLRFAAQRLLRLPRQKKMDTAMAEVPHISPALPPGPLG